MREIKYRAYIKELWKIYEVITLMTKKFEWEDFLRVFINKEAKEWEPANYRIDGVDNILMQYTGLKDKNNTPIFDGDIIAKIWECIRFDYKNPCYAELADEKYANVINIRYWELNGVESMIWDIVDIVVFDENSVWFEPFCDSQNNCWHCGWGKNPNNFTIIWNIYEDIDLKNQIDKAKEIWTIFF